jgi:hypothetical protein
MARDDAIDLFSFVGRGALWLWVRAGHAGLVSKGFLAAMPHAGKVWLSVSAHDRLVNRIKLTGNPV